jgi:UDP-glucose:(heptosyl)LPS alpha-1,3-glucosyltransferase
VFVLERRIFRLRSARHIVAISRRDKAEIEALYHTPGDRVSLVYNGVDLDRFHPDNRARLRRPMREALGLSEDDWVILFVGSGFERKGLGPLLEAVIRLADRRCRLVVAGKGDPERYRRLGARLGLGTRVLWVGPRADVERLYALADVVALPALYEPFGNVHLEALASGVPVLTSACSGGAELISQGDNGWVVAEPSASLVAAGLEALRDLDPSRASLAARRAALPFTHGAQVDALARIYAGLAR